MTQYLGDFAEDDTVLVMFNTFTSDDPSASCTITNFVNTDVHIHKEDDTTQRNNAAGITVSTNFDGITGSHMIKIDTNDNTVAGFWVTGKDYFVRIEGTTVDGATINATVAHFSIENRFMRGTDSAALAATALTDVTWTDAKAGYLDHSISTVDTVVDGIQTDLSNATDGLGALKALIDTVDGVVDTILIDTNDLQTNQGDWLTATGFSTHNAADVWSVATRILTASTNFNDLTAAEVKAEVVAALQDIKLDHLVNIAVDTDWGTTVHLDSVIGHMADVGTAATFDRTQESMEAIRARGDAAWTTGAGGSAPTVGEIRTEMEGAGTKLTLTLEDTADLQGNQAAWATATGFSTHSAVDIWSVGTRALTDKSGFALSTAGIDALWDDLISGMTQVGSVGKLIADNLNATVSSRNATTPPTVTAIREEIDSNSTRLDANVSTRSSHTAADIWSVGTRALTDKTNFGLSTASINLIWDDLISGITQVGSIGKLIADNLNATISSRNATTPPTVTAIRQEMDTNSTKMAPSQTLADYKATGFNTTTPPTVGEIRTEMEGVGTKLLAIEGDTNELQLNQGAWATAVGFSTHSAADIWSVATRALTDKSGFALSATGANLILKDSTFALAMADAIWDEILTGATHNIASSAGRRVREIGAFAIHSGTAQAGNGFSITLAASASADDGVYNRNLIVLTDNTGAGQTRTIVDYDATSKIVVVDREWRVSPDATTEYQIVPDDTPLTVDHGRARGGTATTITLRTYASAIDDTYLCNQIGIIAGPGRGQVRLVGAYNGTSKIVTICGDDWVTTPTTDSIYVMMPYGTTCTSCVGDYALGLIKSEADDALTDIKLDHLIAVADGDDPVNDSIIAQIAASDGDWSGFAKADDALEAIRDRGDTAWNTATSVTVSDKTGFSLSEAGVDAILDENIEGTHTMREMIRLIGAYAAGKSSGGGTATITFRDLDDTKDRIVATVTSVGNRTDVTLTED